MSQNISQSREFYRDYFSDEIDLEYPNKQRYEIVYSLIDEAQLPDSPSVLDIGSGAGRIASFLSERFDDVTSIDIVKSPLMEEVLDDADVSFLEGALPKLPFNEGVFDLVICSEVIEHIPNRDDQREAIKSISSVLSENGKLVLSTPNPMSPYYRLKSAIKNTASLVGFFGDGGGQLVENWIPPKQLHRFITSNLSVDMMRGSYYSFPGFGTGIEGVLRPISDGITSRNLAPRYGLYQYYLASK